MNQPSSAEQAGLASPRQIAIPGRNCWRLAPASRTAFLIDAAAYFAAFVQAVENARQSIMIIAWDIHSRTRLHPDHPAGRDADELGAFLGAVICERRDLQVYILSWDYNLVYAFEREPFPAFRLCRRTPSRLHFALDNGHPVGASLHQKIVVVDDAIAFSGGLDLTIRRWDTPDHLEQHPARVDHHGVPYPPFHDIQFLVDGTAAKALAELARQRWFRHTGQRLAPVSVSSDPWPDAVQPDVTDVNVIIARTEPAYAGRPEVREVEALYLDSIAAARDHIYIENQYFTSRRIAEALGDRLSEANGPEVFIVGSASCPAWIEQQTVGMLRHEFVQHLQQRDRFGRLRCVYPVRRGTTSCPIFVHAKICIIDNTFVRVGSANLTNRSLGLDTECDLALEARGEPRIEAAIAAFRQRLLGEHLGLTPQHVQAVITSQGSLHLAVDALNNAARGFEPIVAPERDEVDSLTSVSAIFDPDGPIDPTDLITRTLPTEAVRHSHRPIIKLAVVLALLVLLGGLWRWAPLQEWLAPLHLMAWRHAIATWSLAPLVVAAGIAVGSLLMIPLAILVPQAAFIFGPVRGFLIAFVGSLLSAVAAFLLGRAMGGEGLLRVSTPRLARLAQRLSRNGLMAVVAIRLLPVAPFTLVNLGLGAARIKLWHFTLGTVLGLIPGFLGLSIFGDRLSHTLHRPEARNFVILGLIASVIILGGSWLVRRVHDGFTRGVRHD